MPRSARLDASGASNQDRHRDGIGSARRQGRGQCRRVGWRTAIVLGAPSRARPAHVVELRPVRIEQGLEEIVEERADVGAKA